MARVVVTARADDDIAETLAYLGREAGFSVAASYSRRILGFVERLALYPESGHPRPRLGRGVKVGVVYPYLVFYRHDPKERVVNIIRVLHGSRQIKRRDLSVDKVEAVGTVDVTRRGKPVTGPTLVAPPRKAIDAASLRALAVTMPYAIGHASDLVRSMRDTDRY